MSEFEEVYTPYIINYNKSIETFNKTLEISSFEEFLIKCQSNPRCKNLSLQDFVSMFLIYSKVTTNPITSNVTYTKISMLSYNFFSDILIAYYASSKIAKVTNFLKFSQNFLTFI